VIALAMLCGQGTFINKLMKKNELRLEGLLDDDPIGIGIQRKLGRLLLDHIHNLLMRYYIFVQS
jgi:hypothetical protein